MIHTRAASSAILFWLCGWVATGACAKPRSDADQPEQAPKSKPTKRSEAEPTPEETDESTDEGAARKGPASDKAGRSCADLHPNVGKFPGLLPPDVPASVAPHLEYVSARSASKYPTHPIVVDREVLLVEHQIDAGRVVVSKAKATATGREMVRTAALPPFDGTPVSSFDFDVAVGKTTVLVAAVVGKQAVGYLIDLKSWKVKSATPLNFADPENIYGLNHIRAAFGEDVYGVAVQGDMRRPGWALGWVTIGEDGTLTKKRLLDSSTYIEPRIAWTGKDFAVLAGPKGDFGPHSLGVWLISTEASTAPTYVPWITPAAGSLSDQRSLYVGGFLVAEGEELHVGMASWPAVTGEKYSQVVHAPARGPARIERCGNGE